MKAIETRYKGYRFRSRLEARWAVFFDALGIDWEYEPEGYDLGAMGWYLPDFLLYFDDKCNGVWFEVKGKKATKTDIEKLQALCNGTDRHGYIASGTMEVPYFHKKRKGRIEISGAKIFWRSPESAKHYGEGIEKSDVEDFIEMEEKCFCGFYEDGYGEIDIDHVYTRDTSEENRIDHLDFPIFAENAKGEKVDLRGFIDSVKAQGHGAWAISKVSENSSILNGGFNTGAGRHYRSKRIATAYRKARSARFEHGETP